MKKKSKRQVLTASRQSDGESETNSGNGNGRGEGDSEVTNRSSGGSRRTKNRWGGC